MSIRESPNGGLRRDRPAPQDSAMPWDWNTYAQWGYLYAAIGVPAGLAGLFVYRRINPVRLSPWTWLLSVCQFPTVLVVWPWLGGPQSLWSLWAALTLPGWMLYRSSRRDVRRTQERRDRQARELATAVTGSRPPRFALYLRAFDTTERLISQPTGHEFGGGDNVPHHLDLETVVHSALWREMPLIAVGRPGDIASGAGRLVLDEVGWQHGVAALAGAAELLIMIPSAHPGTLWEMNWLREHDLLGKTIFVMPEFPKNPEMQYSVNPYLGEGFVRRYDGAEHYLDHDRDWDIAVQAAATIGLELPPYRYEGAMFRLDRSGHVRALRPLALISIGRRVRRVRQLLNDLRAPSDVPPPVRSTFPQPRWRAGTLMTITIAPVVLPAVLSAVQYWLSGWLRVVAWCVIGLLALRWAFRVVRMLRATLSLVVDETGLSLRSSVHGEWHWRWSEIAATEIASAPSDQCLVVFPTEQPADPKAPFWQGDRYSLAGLQFMGIDERDLAASLAHFSGGRHRESPGRWILPEDQEAAPEPREYRMSDDEGPLSGSWLPEQTWFRENMTSRLGFAFTWLLTGGLALWGWFAWVGSAGGFWEVVALPLGIFGLYAVLNRLPCALGGKRLLVSSSGLTFFPPGSVRSPVYFPWNEVASIEVPFDALSDIVIAPVGPPPESGPASRLWSSERGRYVIGIAGIRAADVRAAIMPFAKALNAGRS